MKTNICIGCNVMNFFKRKCRQNNGTNTDCSWLKLLVCLFVCLSPMIVGVEIGRNKSIKTNENGLTCKWVRQENEVVLVIMEIKENEIVRVGGFSERARSVELLLLRRF